MFHALFERKCKKPVIYSSASSGIMLTLSALYVNVPPLNHLLGVEFIDL